MDIFGTMIMVSAAIANTSINIDDVIQAMAATSNTGAMKPDTYVQQRVQKIQL